jgi:uncharacterized protein YdaU (DUF1376 family)
LNFYDFHIGDYASRTAHLEPMEDLAYRRMLDLYYVREQALPADTQEIARLIRLRGHEATIRDVLNEFFALTDKGYIHAKCEEVIAAAQEKRAKAQASANKRWGGCDGNASAMRPHSEGTADAKPTECEGNAPSPSPSPTTQDNPPTPRKRGKSFDPKAMEIPAWIPPAVWFEWCDDRAERKKPVTERAAKRQFEQLREYDRQGFSVESVVSHSIAGGFQGLYPPPRSKQSAADQRSVTVPSKPGRDPALVKLDEDAKKAAPIPLDQLERMAAIRAGKVAH